MPGPIVLDKVILRKYLPFVAAGLAFVIASVITAKFSLNFLSQRKPFLLVRE